MEGAQLLKSTVSEAIAESFGAKTGQELGLDDIKGVLMKMTAPDKVAEGIRGDSLAKANVEEIVKETLENDESGILQQISKSHKNDNQTSSPGTADAGDNDGLLTEAKSRADVVLQKLGHGGLEGATETAKDATVRASMALSQDLDKEAVARQADSAIEQSFEYLQRARTSRKGQQIVEASLTYLKEGMEKGIVQEVVKKIGSETMVDLGKRAISDEAARKQFFENVRLAGVDLLSKSLPSIQIPPISGHRDNVAYTIDGLDLSGFNVGPDAIHIESFDITSEQWNGEVLRLTAVALKQYVWPVGSYRQEYLHTLRQGLADCVIGGLEINLGFKLVHRKAKASTMPETSPSIGTDHVADGGRQQ